jgi:hypothetical protein
MAYRKRVTRARRTPARRVRSYTRSTGRRTSSRGSAGRVQTVRIVVEPGSAPLGREALGLRPVKPAANAFKSIF